LYFKEVLISYRVLFGQDKRSRKLFRSKESSNARFESIDDPILQALCGRKRASLVADFLATEFEREVFDPKIDFPNLGDRLLRVHNYNANQKPSTWQAILSDRRDSRETFNFFWTVVIVGGISITLSLVQTVVSILQLVLPK
jgi:hypothetical protein